MPVMLIAVVMRSVKPLGNLIRVTQRVELGTSLIGTMKTTGGQMNRSILAIALVLMSTTANAVTIKEFHIVESIGGEAWEKGKTYVNGLGSGLAWANAALNVDHQRRLFCPPGKLDLNIDMFLNMIEKSIKEHKYPESTNIELVLLAAMEETFPCDKRVEDR
jgi:hypothetical protein